MALLRKQSTRTVRARPTTSWPAARLRRLADITHHPEHLLQRVHTPHQVFLGMHHRVDVLVGIGVSSIPAASLRHSTPAVARTWSSSVMRRFASGRDIARPAPWLHEQNAAVFPVPRRMKLFAPMEPG